jgi:hypothetical protein
MDYSRITDLLGKFSEILKDSEGKKEVIESVLQKWVKNKIPKERYKIQKSILVFTVSPLVKNELYMHKKEILEELNLLGFRLTDIR